MDKKETTETTLLENMLNILDKEHSIILTPEIGLIGNNEYKTTNKLNVLRKLGYYYPDIKLSDKFRVVTSDAIILIDEWVDTSGLIFEGNNKISYIFKLKDYTAEDDTWSILGDDLIEEKPAVVLYKDGEIQTNCKELKNKYKYNSNIICELRNNKIVRLTVDNIDYSVKTLSFENSIYSFSISKKV